ncbi:hypothetical protein [Ectopseudomonas mendocina]|uniref:Uncharacterized protein n=2 Tax=Ectopseudomonas mendocina TaxID=300 RepID=A0A379J0P0_ECTME|nr:MULTISPECIES: hypothetical protein [Pseudomonas]AEB56937.1 hypothetical protein MDS_0906 [Pseudomonas mendocina NK-01]ALN20664.1 hypothetical protein DW68_019145 [Pseudomonas mendocina S5.2]KER98413.1 hypothetical protein HN51_00890 [Pseudomonas mendocina]TRO36592.1 hypothetical protein EQ832_15495 [Pseudomonas sp. ALS1131]SUD41623.1 Uncharacterised protein [Pseudomonas mendocina]
MKKMLAALFLSAAGLAQAGVLVNSPAWVVALQCDGYQQCYASSNGSYTGNLSGARRFTDPLQAERFVRSFTSSIRDKNPQIQQISEPVCVQPDANNKTHDNGKPC